MKEYEKQKSSDVKELQEIASAEDKKKREKFMRIEKNIKETSSKLKAEIISEA